MSDLIGTENEKIIEFIKNRKNLAQTTGMICAKCGYENKISNYEFINNFEVYYVEKGFSIIDFTCYNCKVQYELSASVNFFSPKIIEESLKTAIKTIENLLNLHLEKIPLDQLSINLAANIKHDLEDKPDSEFSDEKELLDIKNDLKNISTETKEFLITCGLATMRQIHNNSLKNII